MNAIQTMTFDTAKSLILPQILSLDSIRKLGPCLSLPFVNDTVICYALQYGGITHPIHSAVLTDWKVDAYDVDQIARRNLVCLRPDLELQLYRNDDCAAALFQLEDGYDATRLLLDQLHEKLSPELGQTFYAAIPAKNVFIAFPCDPLPFVEKIKSKVRDDFKELEEPITDKLFLVTRDGIAGD
jgi:uncharacterized protein YtpQ (UPF0354 family)